VGSYSREVKKENEIQLKGRTIGYDTGPLPSIMNSCQLIESPLYVASWRAQAAHAHIPHTVPIVIAVVRASMRQQNLDAATVQDPLLTRSLEIVVQTGNTDASFYCVGSSAESSFGKALLP
jgi:hypothetical protein